MSGVNRVARTCQNPHKSYRKPARLVVISCGGRTVNERWAGSLAQALREFAKERYGKGAKKTIIVGNTLTVGNEIFVASDKP